MGAFNVKVYTDTICPWCYIGHKSLDRAIDLYQKTYPGGSKDEFIFTFSPYYLDPSAPKKGIPWEERVIQKNGADMLNAIRMRLRRVGRASGIEFSFNSIIGSTRDSHRLLQYTLKTRGNSVQKCLLEKIFEWHFQHDGDITSRPGLIDAAVEVGLPRDEVTKFLEGDEEGDEVDKLAAQAKSSGVYSVPTIEINGKRVQVEGAGDPHEFLAALIDIKGREVATC